MRIDIGILFSLPHNAARRAKGAPRRSGAGRMGPRERRRAGVPAARSVRGGVGWGVRRGEAPRSN
jgi:hypothetical protein